MQNALGAGTVKSIDLAGLNDELSTKQAGFECVLKRLEQNGAFTRRKCALMRCIDFALLV